MLLRLRSGVVESSATAAAGAGKSGPSPTSAPWSAVAPSRAVDDARDVFTLTTPAQLQADVWEKVLLCQFHDVLPGLDTRVCSVDVVCVRVVLVVL